MLSAPPKTSQAGRPAAASPADRLGRLADVIAHAAHLLPAQGPITVFVHHNTLHAFEDLPFTEAVVQGARTFGCQPYLSEDRYRELLDRGRIRRDDLFAVLLEDLGEHADGLVSLLGTRFHLRLAMLEHPLRSGTDAELRWFVAETDALRRFRDDVSPAVRRQVIDETRHWVMRDLRGRIDNAAPQPPSSADRRIHDALSGLFAHFGASTIERWSECTWEAFTLQALWRACRHGVHAAVGQAFQPDPKTNGHPRSPRTSGRVDTPALSWDHTRSEPEPTQASSMVRTAAEAECQAGKPDLRGVRYRDLLLEATGADSDRLVHDVLVRYCAAFLDQGLAHWGLPHRDEGFYRAFLRLYQGALGPPDLWLRGLSLELARLEARGLGPLESVHESLDLLDVAEEDWDAFLSASLLALRGWAGMVWQMETRGDRAARAAPAGSLVEFLAVRLVLERLALAHVARETLEFTGPLHELKPAARARIPKQEAPGIDQRAFLVFQLAQVLGWRPAELFGLSRPQWSALLREIEAFPGIERRRVFHLALERRYYTQALDALSSYVGQAASLPADTGSVGHVEQAASLPPDAGSVDHGERPQFQVVCCIDEREESFRRHLEEAAPRAETFGVAGFFGVAMYYRGAGDTHFVPLCPVVMRPRHWVQEEVIYPLEETHRRRARTRRALGGAVHRLHVGSRTFAWGALLAAVLGPLASVPLVARILFPRLTGRLRRRAEQMVEPPPLTQLQIERIDAVRPPDCVPDQSLSGKGDRHPSSWDHASPGPEHAGASPLFQTESHAAPGAIGYDVAEMADIVERLLRDIGLTSGLARLVIITGHGSSSLNNPHESAHDCGACAGGRGGPNARAFARMANDPRVQQLLAGRGLTIPHDVVFLGAYHNTCDDAIEYFDLDRLPVSHRPDFEQARRAMDQARERNAHERCRRFESAPFSLTAETALRHVEGRAADLAQTRPEYGHATNAICIVGRRARTRGLFLDRRAFLVSYDPTQDDDEQTVLTRILQAVVPVCAGINLEYYFGSTDCDGWGCGTKLPHNITSLLGVMDGAASDLRTGLPWQMVEIHEPVRLLCIVETTPDVLLRIMERQPAIGRLCLNGWIQLATLDPDSSRIHKLRAGRFEPYHPETTDLPQVDSSAAWYRGWREHLGFAVVRGDH